MELFPISWILIFGAGLTLAGNLDSIWRPRLIWRLPVGELWLQLPCRLWNFNVSSSSINWYPNSQSQGSTSQVWRDHRTRYLSSRSVMLMWKTNNWKVGEICGQSIFGMLSTVSWAERGPSWVWVEDLLGKTKGALTFQVFAVFRHARASRGCWSTMHYGEQIDGDGHPIVEHFGNLHHCSGLSTGLILC